MLLLYLLSNYYNYYLILFWILPSKSADQRFRHCSDLQPINTSQIKYFLELINTTAYTSCCVITTALQKNAIVQLMGDLLMPAPSLSLAVHIIARAMPTPTHRMKQAEMIQIQTIHEKKIYPLAKDLSQQTFPKLHNNLIYNCN